MDRKESGSIFIADDDAFIVKSVSFFLAKKGFKITALENINDIAGIIKRDCIDVVLTDIRMPEISGIELIDKIHAIDPEIPVILMTAFADMDSTISAIKKGAFDFIIKPFDLDYLAHAVEKAITYRRFMEREKAYKKKIEEMNAEVLGLNIDMKEIVAERTLSILGLKVADSIRNPLTLIGGHCRQLLKRSADEYTKEKILEIQSECLRMEKIVGDFDVFVKSKHFLFKREDLNEIVLSTLKLVEQKLCDRAIGLFVTLHEGLLLFNANRQLIKIAMSHIIDNAIDATPAGGNISISTDIREDRIFFVISDNGKGISEEEKARIFDPFYSTKDRIGIGLALVKQIISEHMGEIVLESNVDAGTTLKFIFPVRWKEEESIEWLI